MKKTIIATTLISLGLSATFSHAAFAETEDEKVAQVKSRNLDDSILVTANRSQQDKFLTLSANTIITADEIKTMQVGNISELLDTVAGISVVSQGGAGQASSIFMRGTNSNHTLVLVDGVRINSATLGTTNLTAISPSQIQRIEIVKGPRAALWGSDAIGGVIQIFTKRLYSGEGSITLGAGSNGLLQADAAIGLGNEQHNLTVTVSTESSDGFNAYTTDPYPYDINESDDDGFDRASISLVGKSTINEQWSVNLVSRYESGNSEFDASYPDSPCWDDPTKACPAFYANEQDHENYSIKLATSYQSGSLFSEFSLATSQDGGESFGNGIASSAADKITTERDQVSWINEYRFSDKTSLSVGVDHYNEQVSTNTDKDPWTPDFQSWAVDERDVSAIFLQGRHQLNKFLFEAAVRYDDVENLDSETTYNSSIGYQVNQNWLVSLTRGTGFKAPTFNDLYWPGSGNENLKPEEITNNEILVHYKHNFGLIEVSAFDSEITNLIAWAPNEFGAWQPANVNSADIQGIEATLSTDFGNFNNQLALAFVETEDQSTGKELLRRPELTAAYTLGYHWHDLTLSSVISYRDDSIDAGDIELDSYVLVDLGLSYQASSNLLVNAKVNNIFDEEYETSVNYLSDGTNFKVSATYNF